MLSRVNHRDVPHGPAKAAAYREHYGAPGILLGWGERIVKALGPEFEVLNADHYFAPGREHHGLPQPARCRGFS